MKLAILGCGNMASALAVPMKGHDKNLEISTYTPTRTKAEILSKVIDGSVLNDLNDLSGFDIIMIGCKPQQFDDLAKNVQGLHNKQTIISILAGTTTKTVSSKLGVDSIFRIMPNTPTLVGHGVNAVFMSEKIVPAHKEYLITMFREISKLFVFRDENEIDIVTPVSGSGPGLIFEFARIFQQTLMEMGIDEVKASEMVTHTFLGSAKLMARSPDSFEKLRDNVTSKGGVTFEALSEMKERNVDLILNNAIKRAYKRAVELSKN